MKIKPYVQKLEQSSEYKNFRIKYPEAYIVAGFFVIDLEAGKNIHQIDFYLPKEKKIAAFTLDGGVQLQILDMISKDKKLPEKLDLKTKIDLDALEGILTDEMRNRGISDEVKKIIAVVQNIEGKKIWNLNCVLTGMEILKSHVEDNSKSVLKMERTSLVDVMKRMSLQPQVSPPPAKKEDLDKQVADLEKLEEEIKKQKDALKQEFDKKEESKVKMPQISQKTSLPQKTQLSQKTQSLQKRK